jgi:hypothetical protein
MLLSDHNNLALGTDLVVKSRSSMSLEQSRSISALSISSDERLVALGDKSGRVTVCMGFF